MSPIHILKHQWRFKMRISLIVAKAQNNVIGKNNALPWRLKDDLQNFKMVTPPAIETTTTQQMLEVDPQLDGLKVVYDEPSKIVIDHPDFVCSIVNGRLNLNIIYDQKIFTEKEIKYFSNTFIDIF